MKTKEEYITERTRIISEMLDNPDECGIYPTTKCFQQLDELFDRCQEYADQPTDEVKWDKLEKDFFTWQMIFNAKGTQKIFNWFKANIKQ